MKLHPKVNSSIVKKRFVKLEEDMRAVHGDKYDYSKAIYKSSRDNIIIICKKHGEFSQRPDHHLSGRGCKNCTYKIPTTEEYIQKVKSIHGDKYDYSQVKYTNRNKKITIICAKHGKFKQRASDHKTGYGCPKCAGNIKKTTEQFIKDAKMKHNDKYDYSKVEYRTNRDEIIITCDKHGDFLQTPTTHLRGGGCNRCGNNIRSNDEYILKAKEIHLDKYTYEKTDFKDSRDHVIITCPEHGDFHQIAGNHILGKGCPGCSKAGFDCTKSAILYYLSINNGEAYKIGITNKSIKKRYYREDRKKINILKTWQFEDGHDALQRETKIKRTFSYVKYKGKDLLYDGNSELFSKDILSEILQLIDMH